MFFTQYPILISVGDWIKKKYMNLKVKCECLQNEAYYLNKCSGQNEIGREETKYGYSTTHLVDDKKVVLTFNQYGNGEDDYDDELVAVDIEPIKSLLDNLKDALAIEPMQLLRN